MADALKNLSRREMTISAEAFAKFDHERSGVITLHHFTQQLHKSAARGGKAYTEPRLRSMFEAADLTGTGEVWPAAL